MTKQEETQKKQSEKISNRRALVEYLLDNPEFLHSVSLAVGFGFVPFVVDNELVILPPPEVTDFEGWKIEL